VYLWHGTQVRIGLQIAQEHVVVLVMVVVVVVVVIVVGGTP